MWLRTWKVAILIALVYLATFEILWVALVHTLVIYPFSQSYSWEIVPLANNGGSDNFEITSWHNGHNMRGWIQFNVSSIPQTALITSATLRLRLWVKTTNGSQLGDPTGRLYGVYALTGPWQDEGINWVNQPNWTNQDSATSPVPPGQGGWYGPFLYMDWDVTGMVRDWRSGAMPNYGAVVKDTQENASLLYSTQFFTIHQTPNQTYYPRLIVKYLIPQELYTAIIVVIAETALILMLLRRAARRSKH